MPVRGDIVDYTYATQVDVQDPDGVVRPKIGYVTRPAVVMAEPSPNVCDLFVFCEPFELGEMSPNTIARGVLQGPAAPDTRKGSRVDPTAQPGQPGTWSAR